MTRIILIGKGRRITLDELRGVSCGEDKLEIPVAAPAADAADTPAAAEDASMDDTHLDVTAALERLTLNTPTATNNDNDSNNNDSNNNLSPSATIAALTLLALTLAQGRVIKSAKCEEVDAVVSALVDLVNHVQSTSSSSSSTSALQLPVDATSFAHQLTTLLGSICPPSLLLSNDSNQQNEQSGQAKPFLRRILPLARLALSLSQARELGSKSVSDVMAALSAERLSGSAGIDSSTNGSVGGGGGSGGGGVNFTDCFSSLQFDELRPHRGCIESASVLRACLQGSTLISVKGGSNANGANTNNAAVRYTQLTPQYHGPSRESIGNACKTLELEINCSESGSESVDGAGGVGGMDDTVALLAGKSALEAVRCLTKGSAMRATGEDNDITGNAGTNGTMEQLALALETSVSSLQRALETEAFLACQFIQSELAKKEAELKAKEAEKARRAANNSNPNNPNSNANSNPNNANANNDEFAGMSEAQKAKILKKRAEKEAKAAAKRKAKEAKAAGGEAALSSLFGAGTALVYPLLMNAAAANSASSPTELTPESFHNLLSSSSHSTTLSLLQQTIDTLLSGGLQRKPKVPKGTRDYLPPQMAIRATAFQIIRRVFLRHGAVEIDTPVFELKETLTGKYGEDSKLIYDLADQGGELLALRYDLTVPFARFLAVNAVGNIKRFHIGKVYRRDQPALSKGRYREFYQCDFDIAGVYGRMVPDAECVAVACEILDNLPIGNFGVKLNHRRLLDAILDLCGVPSEKFRTICSAVDKLDKEPWGEVRREMVEEKGLSGEVADRIGEFVVLKGKPWEMYHSLMGEKKFGKHAGAAEAMEDLRIMFEYLEAMGKLEFVTFDLSLARGLDYYTGVIYEAVCMNGNTQVGSIGGGGRYDNLVSMFQEAGKVTPCVGVSVGIERVFTLMEERLREQQGGSIQQPNVHVLVASAGENLLPQRMSLAKTLWDANISAEFSQQENPKLKFEIANALERGIPFMVIAGEEEAKENKCKVKDLNKRTEETVEVKDLVRVLRGKGVVPVGCEFAMEILNGSG